MRSPSRYSHKTPPRLTVDPNCRPGNSRYRFYIPRAFHGRVGALTYASVTCSSGLPKVVLTPRSPASRSFQGRPPESIRRIFTQLGVRDRAVGNHLRLATKIRRTEIPSPGDSRLAPSILANERIRLPSAQHPSPAVGVVVDRNRPIRDKRAPVRGESVPLQLGGDVALVLVSSTPFSPPSAVAINASGVVPVTSSRFVFIDNNDDEALLELNVNPDGTQHGPVVRRPIAGLDRGAMSDPEGIARIDRNAAIDLIVASSLSVWGFATSGEANAHDGLVRIRYTPNGQLHGEAMPRFREWLIDGYPDLDDYPRQVPNDNGLNIEGLAWDPSRRALLFGLRSPVTDRQIRVLSVGLDTAAPWTTAALTVGPTLLIEKSDHPVAQGIRDIDYDAQRQEFLVLVGRSTIGLVPFELCTWDGVSSDLNVLDVTFTILNKPGIQPPMKPEGVTAIPGHGPRKVLIVDDAGGFADKSV